jgi:Domain of unknown function (DUF5615)
LSIRFQADADLNFDIVKAVRRREPGIDFASAIDAELEGIADAEILERAANEHRVLVSHDRRTMLHTFRNRLKAGKFSHGLLIVSQGAPIGPVVEAIIVLWSVCDPAELRDQVYHVPSLIHHVFPR